jgi:hypothetical protein
MPDLNFKVTGVEPATQGMAPLLVFALEVTNRPAEEQIQSATLQAQIQFECPKRAYTDSEKEKLTDLFGAPERWGQTLRNRLWTFASTALSPFSEKTTAKLPVPCSFDLNLSAAKYFHAIEEGDVPLLFLFGGTVSYSGPDGRLQTQRIAHEKEATWRMPGQTWRKLMDHHWPNTAWVLLQRDVFERLYEFKRRNGLPTWEQTIERLLAEADAHSAAKETMFNLIL